VISSTALVRGSAALLAIVGTLTQLRAVDAAPFSDFLVQPPRLAAPERGSVAGELSQLGFAPGNLARGDFNLPMPIALPSDRGAPLIGLVPAYASSNGQSEWGMGWQLDLSIRRSAIVGDIDPAGDEFVSPWGRLVKRSDGSYAPTGAAPTVTLRRVNGGWQAITGDGNQFTFAVTDSVANGHAWMLSRVDGVLGDETVLSYTRNASGRPFLSAVEWGGRGSAHQYRLELDYETITTPLEDYRAGVLLTLDRRVREARVRVRSAASTFETRATYQLEYTAGPRGAAFYLTGVTRRNRFGVAEPTQRYRYDFGDVTLATASLRDVPALSTVLASTGGDALQPNKASELDVEDDALADFEIAKDQSIVHRSGSTFTIEPLATVPGAIVQCRPPPSTTNTPRALVRMTGDATELKVFRSITNGATFTTRVLVCNRQGVPELDHQLPGEWGLGPTTRLVDLNHDHRPDLIRVFSKGYQVVENTSDETGYHFVVHPVRSLSDAFTPSSTWVQDMNGDGQGDLVMRFSSSVSVWYGLGQFRFTPTARSLTFKSISNTTVTDLAQRQLTFVDINHDGLTDVMTTRDRALGVFINNGRQLQEVIVPGLTSMSWDFGAPVIADVTGSGNVEVLFVQGTTAKAIALDSPATGLLTSADDGKGTVARFGYARSTPVAGIRQRTTVLANLTLESSGYDTVTYSYSYGEPVLHSLGKHLVGFSSVDKSSPHVIEHVELLNDDDVSGVPALSETFDQRTPGIVRFSRSHYEDVTLDGVRWLRPSSAEVGYRNGTGNVTLASTTQYNAYERGFCPSVVTTTAPGSQLVSTSTLASVARIPDALHCLPASQNLFGTHTDVTRNFHYLVNLERNAVGLVTRVTQFNPMMMMQSLVLQDITYDTALRKRTIGAPGRGTTTADYDSFGRLASLTDPTGVVTLVEEADPVSDSVLALSTLRPNASTTMFFRYDSRDRLASSWDDLSGSTETTPLMAFTYQDATQSMPGRVDSVALADVTGNLTRHTAALVAADGEPMVAGTWLGNHFALGHVSIANRNTLTQRTSFVGAMTATAFAAMTSDDLRGFGAPLVETVAAGFGHSVQTTTTQQQGVVGVVTSDLVLGTTELVARSHQPGGFTAEVATDAAGRLVRKTDELGVTHLYAYDALGRLITASTPDGNQTLEFDGFGRPSRVTRAGVGAMSYAYDPVSGLAVRKQHLDRSGTVVNTSNTTYDAIGRATAVVQSTTTETSTVNFDYDGNLGTTTTAAGQLGRLSHVGGAGWDRTTLFDPAGRAYRQSLTLAGWRDLTSDTTYRADGSVASDTLTIADTDGTALLSVTKATDLDSLGRVSALRVNGAVIYTLSYDAENRLARADFTSGESITFDYDPVTHRRSGYSVDAPNASGGVHWERDERGLVAAETYAHDATTRRRTYSYDGRGMLIGANTGVDVASYGYTPSGLPNSITDQLGTRSVHRAGDQLTVDGVTYTWDAAGRVVGKGAWTFSYGPDGQLAHANRPGRDIEFVYDEKNERLLKRVDGVPVRASVAGGVLTNNHFVELIAVGGIVAGVLDNGQFTALLTDPRGTPFADSDGSSNLASPYGVRDTQLGISEVIDYAKLGWDPDLDVVRMGVRDYDAKLSQFLTPDPLYFEDLESCESSPLQCSLYGYAVGNPISFVDPSGTDGLVVPPPTGPVWTPPPAVAPPPPPAPVPPTTPAPAPTSSPGLGARVAAIVTPGVAAAVAGGTVFFWPRNGDPDRSSDCSRPGSCSTFRQNPPLPPLPSEPERRQGPKQRVNLDTSAIVGATQLDNPWVTASIHAYLFDKEPVATQTAVKEFIGGTAFQKAGPTERVLAGLFLLSVTVIPDDPSARVMNLQVGSSKRAAKRLGPLDKIIFGTGDKLGIPTVTHDNKFVKAAAKQGVILNAIVFDPVTYSGI
jgi:RHS repeat-associated protein